MDEYCATGTGCVRVGGELKDGKRVEGRIVTVKEWLDMIRQMWGIKQPVLGLQVGGGALERESEIGEGGTLQ